MTVTAGAIAHYRDRADASYTFFDADGAMWHFNLPSVVAASPDALLLPREVVEADGLDVREPVGP